MLYLNSLPYPIRHRVIFVFRKEGEKEQVLLVDDDPDTTWISKQLQNIIDLNCRHLRAPCQRWGILNLVQKECFISKLITLEDLVNTINSILSSWPHVIIFVYPAKGPLHDFAAIFLGILQFSVRNFMHSALFLKPVPANAGFETIAIVATEAARTIATKSNPIFILIPF